MEADIAVIVVNTTIFNELKRRCIDSYIKRQFRDNPELWAKVELPCSKIPVLIKKYQRGCKSFSKWIDMRNYLNGTH